MKLIKPSLTKKIYKWNEGDCSFSYFSKNIIINKIFYWRIKKALRMVGRNDYSKKVPNIIDLGAGCGILIPSLSKYGEVYATDKCLKYINKAKLITSKCNIRNYSLCVADIKNIPFKKVFDIVFCLSVLEHVELLDNSIKQIYKIMNKGGVLIVGIPYTSKFVNFLLKIFRLTDDIIHEKKENYMFEVEKTLKKYFLIEKIEKIPFDLIPDSFSLYKLFRCIRE